jgi:trimethylamine--corrinoid protein Co-methyltransferase
MADQLSDVLPRIHVLTREQIEHIHAQSLEILSSVGIRVDSVSARKIFAKAGCKSNSDHIVKIPADLVSGALQSAPSFVDIYNRLGQQTFRLGGSPESQTRFGVGVTNLYFQDPTTDRVEPFTRRHMATGTRLGNSLSEFDFVSTIGILQDISPQIADLFAALEMTANTVKPLVVLVSKEQCFDAVLDLFEQLTGELATHPFVIPYFNPISPLILNEGTADKMITAIERGLPFVFSNYGMSGATTPITALGTIVLLNAELLAGLLFSQLVKEGTPIILGSFPASFDMKDMVNRYTPQSMVLNLACAEMMQHYELPHCGTSGSGNGWGADLFAGDLLWMNHLTSCLGKVGMAPFVGGNFYSKVFSPAIVVYANAVIRKARLLAQGISITDGPDILAEIKSTGPGGSFLTAESTIKNCRKLPQDDLIWPHFSLEKWQSRGCPKAEEYLREYTVDKMENMAKPQDHDELIEKGERFIEKLASERKSLCYPN